MRVTAISIGIWVSLVVVTIIEVLWFYVGPGSFVANAGILILAIVNAVLISAFTMNLRTEGKPIRYIMIVPLIFAIILIVTLLFTFPTR